MYGIITLRLTSYEKLKFNYNHNLLIRTFLCAEALLLFAGEVLYKGKLSEQFVAMR